MTGTSSRLPFVVFWLLGIIWGCNFMYMKLAAGHISPLQIAFARVLFGFIPVVIFATITGAIRREHVRHTGHFFVMGMLAAAVYYYGFAKGTSLLLSGVAGAVSGAIPLFSFVIALILVREERVTRTKIAGILVGFLGVALIARPSGAELAATNLKGVAYMVGGSLSVGASFVYARKFLVPLKIPAAALTTYQLGFGLLVLLMVTDLHGIGSILDSAPATVGLVAGLGFLGTGTAFLLYYYVIKHIDAVTASSITYIPPVVALLVGALFGGEPIGLADYGATALILTGVLLSKRS